ncbi:MAG: winged helix-turn-helix domain-containing protein [Methanothrix sp.]
MGRKRYKDQILCKILQVCGGVGANKTQIVYNCNLNFHTVMPYLELLIKNGLVARVDGKVARYQTTPRGTDALWHFRELAELIAEFRGEAEEMPAE